jgi:pyruvate formate lyase activating enzyme
MDGSPARCAICGSSDRICSSGLGVCLDCIRRHPQEAVAHTSQRHATSRSTFHLPPSPPQSGEVSCGLCVQNCQLSEGEYGYCGMRSVFDGRLVHHAGAPKRGLLHWYRDPLPTNCVADWVCQGHNQYGYHNLAVFYGSCTLDCLFCQNWHYRLTQPDADRTDTIHAMTAEELADCADPRTYCVCFFGGDPASQMPHALATASALAKRGVTVCWETAGTMHPRFLKRAMELSLETGGCVKFDLKAHDEALHIALTGSTNVRTLENFQLAGALGQGQDEPPPLIASTLLVPGYVDAEEVGRIAAFIRGINPAIPYALLAFHPSFEMSDLPCTSRSHAQGALSAAQEAGLTRVRLGNIHLLGWGV